MCYHFFSILDWNCCMLTRFVDVKSLKMFTWLSRWESQQKLCIIFFIAAKYFIFCPQVKKRRKLLGVDAGNEEVRNLETETPVTILLFTKVPYSLSITCNSHSFC